MYHPLLSLLPAIALCLPLSADMIAGIALGDKKKDVLRKVAACKDFTPLNTRAKYSLENSYRLAEKVAGQNWDAHFLFNHRNRELNKLVFVSDKALRPELYNKLMKSFYVFTSEHIREHFELQEPLNTPVFSPADALEKKTMFALHAYPGDGFMLTLGLWKDKEGGIRLCFSVQPATNSALGDTSADNTGGKQEDWDNIPRFSESLAGKAFLAENNLGGDEDDEDDDVSEEATEERRGAYAVASSKLPQVEQDMLNALLRLAEERDDEGIEKLEAAAEAGNARALYELACCYANGLHGVESDAEQAEDCFRKAATAGYALAMVRYGAEFHTALEALELTAEDGKKLIHELYAAIGGPHPSARFNYAIMLRYGYGVRKDAPKALELMKQLTREGDPTAAALAEEWEQ